jgi:nucleoside-diphosphate kinase
MPDITLTIVKPDAVENGHTGGILDMIIKAGFHISALKMCHLTKGQAEAFYSVHAGKHFFDSLVEYMTSGPVVAAVLEKNNAVEDFRKLIGATDPAKADEGTIRKKFGLNFQNNAVHGSDSIENAKIEASFFFSLFERFHI